MNKIKVLLFDTKSTGLPKHFKPAEEDLENYPSVLQFGAMLIELDLDDLSTYKIIFGVNELVKPYRGKTALTIHPKAIDFHGIDFDKANVQGESIEAVCMLFQGLCNSADLIVSHNYTLHRNIMATELLKLGIMPKYNKGAKVLCTMKYGTNILEIPGKKEGQFKFPTVEDLFMYVTEQEVKNFFDVTSALDTTKATATSLVGLLQTTEVLHKWCSGEIPTLHTR